MRLPRLRKPDMSTPAKRQRVALLVGAAAVGLLFVMAMALPLASNPTFCGKTCHSQSPQFESWLRSSHAKVTCYACHMDKLSISHLIKLKAVDAPIGIINTMTNSLEKPINKESEYSQHHLPAERCERCHTNENRKFTFSKGIYMNHMAHKEAGIACTVCHNRVAHKGAEEFEPLKSEWAEAKGFEYENFLTMKEGCFRCHSSNASERKEETLALIKNDKKPPQACTTCHTKDFALPGGHGSDDWRNKHPEVAKKDFTYCFECHGPGKEFDNAGKPFCTVCHDEQKVATFTQQVVVR